MSHSYVQNHLHVVFSTKERKKLIVKPMQPKLWSYMAGIARNHGFLVIANGGMEDHVHLLIQLPPILPLAKAIALLKANSSKWMREHGTRFAWQEGYGVFSVGASILDAVVRYIGGQERHHRKMSFEHEFICLLNEAWDGIRPRGLYSSRPHFPCRPHGARPFSVPVTQAYPAWANSCRASGAGCSPQIAAVEHRMRVC